MQSIKNLSRIFLALSVVSVFVFSVAMPLLAQTAANRDVVDAGGGAQTGALSSCSSIFSNGASGVVGCIVGFFNTAIGLIIAAAVVYIVWGAFTMIRSEEKREEGKKVVLYGIIGLFVMVSIWGFVNILTNTFGTKTVSAPPIPTLIKI